MVLLIFRQGIQLFKSIDGDGDGHLAIDELRSALKLEDVFADELELPDWGVVERNDPKELQERAEAHLQQLRKHLRRKGMSAKTFMGQFVSRGHTSASLGSFAKGLGLVSMELDRREVIALFRLFDQDANGHVSISELQRGKFAAVSKLPVG